MTSYTFGSNVSNPTLLSPKPIVRRNASNAATGQDCSHCGRKTNLKCAKCGRAFCSKCLTESEEVEGKVCIDCL